MSDFSRSPRQVLAESIAAGYVGLHVEQGVPVLDRDLNLLQDLLAARVSSLFAAFVGDGVPAGSDAFRIGPVSPPANDFVIGGPGSLLVAGLQVPITTSRVLYSGQPPALQLPGLVVPPAGGADPRLDTVYLDAWLDEVDGTPDLDNSADVGMQTSVRLRIAWAVRVTEGSPVPAAAPGHVVYVLGEIRRPPGEPTIDISMLTDRRQARLTVSALEQRLALVEQILLRPKFVAPPGGAEFEPQTGAIGEPITLHGDNFDVGDVEVLFGQIPAAVIGVAVAGGLEVAVPGGLTPDGISTPVAITVRNQGGPAASTDRFTPLLDPALGPPGHQFSPARGPAGSVVTLTGFNLNLGTPGVVFASALGPGQPGTVQPGGTNTALSVQVPTGLLVGGAQFADVVITVTTVPGTQPARSTDTFRVQV